MKKNKSKQYFFLIKKLESELIKDIDSVFFENLNFVFEKSQCLEIVIENVNEIHLDFIIKNAHKFKNMKMFETKTLYKQKCDLIIKSIVYHHFQEIVISKILNIISDVFNVEISHIQSKCRIRHIVEARHCFLQILNKYNQFLTLNEIGSYVVPNFHHDTVIHSISNVNYFLEKKEAFSSFNKKYKTCEEKISKFFLNKFE